MLVNRESRAPVPNQRLALNRPPGNYPPISMLVLGVPQATTIATAVTDRKGRFEFVTRKDRQRYLRIHLAAISRDTRLKPSSGFVVISLSDSLGPRHAEFDDDMIYYDNGKWDLRPYR